MEQVSIADLGFTNSSLCQLVEAHPRGRPPVYFTDVFESPSFNIVAFILPTGCSLPLHDHPGMLVLSKLIFGKLSICCWDAPQVTSSTPIREQESAVPDPMFGYRVASSPAVVPGACGVIARRAYDAVISLQTPDAPPTLNVNYVASNLIPFYPNGEYPTSFVALPTKGNLHSLQSLDTSVILDLLAPPYDLRKDRPCTYYEASMEGSQSESKMTVLERGGPEEFIRLKYRGPPLVSSDSAQ